MDDVCRWWSEGGAGVCALIGIGGAGKTAVADRFLRMLPEVLPPHADVPKRSDLRVPERLFVFSFYDAPNPDSFFSAIADWLAGPPKVGDRQPSYQQLLQLLQSAVPIPQSQIENQKSQILLVLDGLEKVQDDGVRGGVFGELQDDRLSDLLVRVAEGFLPSLSVLITSRFPLAKLDDQSCAYYRPLRGEFSPATRRIGLTIEFPSANHHSRAHFHRDGPTTQKNRHRSSCVFARSGREQSIR